jgi:hypothetical protein
MEEPLGPVSVCFDRSNSVFYENDTSGVSIVIETIEEYRKNVSEIERVYMGKMTHYSITYDLVSLYLKGQKLLYTESKTFCEMLLYGLMLPAIFISSLCTVLNVPLKDYSYGSTVVSSLNGFNSFLLAVVTYLKLDAKAEAHKSSAYQFDKLQAECEFNSGKTQMMPDNQIELVVGKYLEDVQKKVQEIKDANQFSIPEVIRYRYHHIYSYNIFAMMKEYKTKRSIRIQRLMEINRVIRSRENERTPLTHGKPIQFVQSYPKEPEISFFSFNKKAPQGSVQVDIYDQEIPRAQLMNMRDNLIKEIIEYRDMTVDLSKDYNGESETWINKKRKEWFPVFNWLKT